MEDNYCILGLKKGATLVEIKAQFRSLSKTHHPDKGGNAEQFIRIRVAYEALLKGDEGGTKYQFNSYKEKPKQTKVATYRFINIKKDSDAYLVSFHTDGVDTVDFYGEKWNNLGTYNIGRGEWQGNLRVTFEDAKKANYIFRFELNDGYGKSATVSYSVKPPKKSILEKIKNLFK